jgi:hypothetical protein
LVPVTSGIQGIDFEGALDTPIAIVSSTGADIEGNRIANVVPLLLRFGFTETEGIFVSGFQNPQNAVTGKITILNNTIEMNGGDFSNGMQFDSVAADIDVRGNNVTYLASNGDIQTTGITLFRSLANVNVSQNVVMMGPGDPNAFPVGIFAGGHAEARYMIANNTIITNHPNADGMDIVGFSNSGPTEKAVVVNNHIVTHSTISTAGGIAFVGAVKDSQMVANQMEGTTGDAIQILGLSPRLVADSNHALGNDIAGMMSLGPDVFLGSDSTNNFVAGHCNTFIDLGVSNHVTCGP